VRVILRIAVLLSVMAALAATGASASAEDSVSSSVWHRLVADQSNPGPQHERLSCVQRSISWVCRYDKDPTRSLNFYWDGTTGRFEGRDVTAGWSCPAWFPTSVCANVTRVVRGTARYIPAVGGPFAVRTELIFSGTGTDQRLHVYWVDQFVCPWFSTFAQALAANPFPLPFNGVNWPAQDCIGAP
jgi:hypothetical protein